MTCFKNSKKSRRSLQLKFKWLIIILCLLRLILSTSVIQNSPSGTLITDIELSMSILTQRTLLTLEKSEQLLDSQNKI